MTLTSELRLNWILLLPSLSRHSTRARGAISHRTENSIFVESLYPSHFVPNTTEVWISIQNSEHVKNIQVADIAWDHFPLITYALFGAASWWWQPRHRILVFLWESGLQENSAQLLKKLKKFSTGLLRSKKVYVYMYVYKCMCLKFDLSVHKMSCTRCWLLSSSFTSVIYKDLSPFQVCMELSYSPLLCMKKPLELEKFLLRTFLQSFETGIVNKLWKFHC